MREPTEPRPLRWGRRSSRLILGLGLIFAGGLLVQLTSAYSLWALPIGVLTHGAGWCILPGRGGRRILAAFGSALTVIIILNGASAMAFLAIPLAGWLFVRQRPPISYATLMLPPVIALVVAPMFTQYGNAVIVLPIMCGVVVGSAWLARSLSEKSGRISAKSR